MGRHGSSLDPRWRPSTSSRCTGSPRCIRRTRRPQGRHARLPARRQDRRARLQRRRQVDACCGSWPGVDTEFRGDAQLAPGATRRAARAGAPARRGQGRARQRRGRRRRDRGAARPLQRAGRRTTPTRPPTSSRDLQAEIDAADAWNLDTSSSTRWTRCACRPRTPTSRRSPAASAAASRCAGCCSRSPTCCCSTSRPTTSTPSRSAWLERHLAEYAGTIVAVTHDRYFLDNVAGWILELDRGRGLPYEGNYSSWLEQKQERLALEEKSERARQRTIAAELEWVRQNPKGRQKKEKARLNNYDALVAQERNVKLDDVQIHIPAGPRLGDVVVEAEGLRKGFGDRLLIEDLELLAAARRDRRRSSAPTARARRRCSG